MSLHNFLTRLIWLCVLPLVLLSAWLAIDSVRTTQDERDLKAANLAKNFATTVDQDLSARIGALHMLSMSPMADQPSRWKDFYQEARGFQESFGSHVILADLKLNMLLNTRSPFGTVLPALPHPKGHAAAPTALATGEPAVGDSFIGPVAKELLVAIAVPGERDGKTAFLLLTTFEASHFQRSIEQIELPPGWSLSLVDGKGDAIARRAPQGLNVASDVDAGGRFVVKSAHSPWSVVLEIPRDIYRAPLVAATSALALVILGATLAGVFGGILASRRLGRAVASLASAPTTGAAVSDIAEIAAVRRLLDESAARREGAEAALRELNAGLEQRVEQRTAELTAANKELDSFAYAVSHDLRAPLRAMSGFSQALTEDYGDRLEGDAKNYLEQIGIASRKMGELIEGILALSRSTRGDLRRDPIDLSALAAAVINDLARSAPGRKVAVDIEPGLIVRGDARMIEAVMRNLLGNAWKYTEKTPAPAIRLYAGEVGGARGICVADNGAGFDMAYADQLFQPFRRLHRQDEFPGIGIGLATVQRIVHRHGGRICAHAAPGKGATFCFTLAAESEAA